MKFGEDRKDNKNYTESEYQHNIRAGRGGKSSNDNPLAQM